MKAYNLTYWVCHPTKVKPVAAVVLALVWLLAGATDRAWAAPISPGLLADATPLDLTPGQAGLAVVSGAYPLRVSVTLDNSPLDVFWSGSSYEAVFAFGLDEPAGSHTLVIQADDPGSGASLKETYTVTVHNHGFPSSRVSVPLILVPLLDAELDRTEADQISALVNAHTRPATVSWPFISPLPQQVLITGFGEYRTYNGGLLTSRHTGLDLRSMEGDPVGATADGWVVAADYFKIHGNMIILDHGHGVYSLYAHLSQMLVNLGERVRQGQVIGETGLTGRASGPHLHFELVINGTSIDPVGWLAFAPGYVPPVELPTGNPPGG